MIATTLLATAALALGAAEASAVNLHVRQTSEFTIYSTGYASCDASIAAGLSDNVYFPIDAQYKSSISSYWSGSVQQLRPWCIIQPENTEEVSKALAALVKSSPAGNWDIAVRGGGHSHFGSNTVAQGVTIDLSRLDSTVYKNCSIGGGSRWAGVFNEIEKHGRTATGGGNNFGIVTRFDLQTFEAAKGGLYGGLFFMSYDNRDAVLAQFSRLVKINHEHLEDTEVVTFTYSGSGAPMIAGVAINTAGVENSTSFAP
ncbi:hypothetical protein ACHAQH_007963 [Verticillium albo-atrum]